jgi:hypothetical protein
MVANAIAPETTPAAAKFGMLPCWHCRRPIPVAPIAMMCGCGYLNFLKGDSTMIVAPHALAFQAITNRSREEEPFTPGGDVARQERERQRSVVSPTMDEDVPGYVDDVLGDD